MSEKTPKIRLRTTLILWIVASLITLILFNGIVAALQTAFTAIRQGMGSEEITTPFEAFLFRAVRIVIFDFKYILITILLWGILFYFVKAVNRTRTNMILSTTITFIVSVAILLLISRNIIDKAVILDTGIYIYLSLLVPRFIFSKLRPWNVQVR